MVGNHRSQREVHNIVHVLLPLKLSEDERLPHECMFRQEVFLIWFNVAWIYFWKHHNQIWIVSHVRQLNDSVFLFIYQGDEHIQESSPRQGILSCSIYSNVPLEALSWRRSPLPTNISRLWKHPASASVPLLLNHNPLMISI